MMQRILPLILFLLLAGAGEATAKWWIFGQSQDEVATRYLFLNDIAYDELGEKVTLYRDTLPGGRVIIKGRGQAGKNRIGAVQISTDGGAGWQAAKLAADGSFEFGFTPVIGRDYNLEVKILDTAGKSNDAAETRKALTVSSRNIQEVIREALDGMIDAYRREDPRAFMQYVDPDFAGDPLILDSAIRKDFTALDQIEMRYTLNNVVAGAGGRVFTSISFARQVVVARTGAVLEDRGQTEFTFTLRGEKALVYSMKTPLIFGLSEAEDVATGEVNSAENRDNLEIGPDGVARLGDAGPDAGNVLAPTNLAVYNSWPHHQYSFSFDFPIDYYVVDLSTTYEIILEESLNPGGPWTEVFREPFWDPRFPDITTFHIGNTWAYLYYRVKVEAQATGEQSLPTNVVMVDNR